MEKFVHQLREHYTVREHRNRALEDWFQLIRIPSVSQSGTPVQACADLICTMMQELGAEVESYELPYAPVILGRVGRDSRKKTVLIYAHYDVKPAGNSELWNTEPFEPVEIEGKIYARGASDNKAPLAAHLNALRYYRATGQELPVNLVYLFEGNEEVGSKGLADFLEAHKDEINADVVFFSDGPRDPSGLPIIALGAKGSLSLTITLRTMSHDVHSRYAPVLPSAAWQMVELLSKLKSGDRVLIPGFYDGIIPLTEQERELIAAMPSSEERLNKEYEAEPQNIGEEFYPRLFCSPTFNICKMSSGGAGVVPACAEAELDIRLAPGQTAANMERMIRAYICDELGYKNAKLCFTPGMPPSKTSLDTPYLSKIIDACNEIYGGYVIYPCRPSSAPDYLWTDVLGLPALQVRWSDADSNNHAPNEHLSIKEYFDGIALTAYAIQKLAEC